MGLVDQSTEEVTRLNMDIIKFAMKTLLKYYSEEKEKQFIEKAKKDMEHLKKFFPHKVKNADIEKEDINRFIEKANEKNIKAFEIEESGEIPTLFYSIDDEYKIIEIFKEIQNEKDLNKELSFIDKNEILDNYDFKIDLETALDTKIEDKDYREYLTDVIENDSKGINFKKSEIKGFKLEDLEKIAKKEIRLEKSEIENLKEKTINLNKEIDR